MIPARLIPMLMAARLGLSGVGEPIVPPPVIDIVRTHSIVRSVSRTHDITRTITRTHNITRTITRTHQMS